MQKIHISFEGNIGVGKSTILSEVHNHFRYTDISYAWEPLDEWDENGFLNDMYSKNIQHAEFQHMVISSMFQKSFMGLSQSNILIQERSMDAALEVFTKSNVKNSRSMELLKYSYDKLKQSLQEAFSIQTFRIYLRVPPHIAFARVSKRSRSSESSISEEYINTINDSYEEWLCFSSPDSSVIIIDASRDIEEVTRDVIKAVTSIIQPKRLAPKKLFN